MKYDNFITCPFCSGHDGVSPEAAGVIARLIGEFYLTLNNNPNDSLTTELSNIRNVILNTEDREQLAPEESEPICPTPKKRRYARLGYTTHDAQKWHQHPYKCECGYWHLSKQSGTEHQAKINSPAASADEFEEIDPLLL